MVLQWCTGSMINNQLLDSGYGDEDMLTVEYSLATGSW